MTPGVDMTLVAADKASLEAAHVRLLAQARYRVSLWVPSLDIGLFDSEAALAEFRRLGTSGRQARIRILTHDANRAHREGHRLLALAARLPTAFAVHVPVEETHLRYGSAFLTDETSAYLFRPVERRFEAEGSLEDAGETSRVTALFEEVWERSEPAWEIRPLGI